MSKAPTPMPRPTGPQAAPRRIPGASATGRILPPIKRRPDLETMKAAPDPIDESRYPGELEGDQEAELDMVAEGFRERMKNEAKRFGDATDSSYYFVAVFESPAQAAAFTKALQLPDKRFIDGRAMADRLGIDLPAGGIKLNPSPRLDPTLSRLVRRPGER